MLNKKDLYFIGSFDSGNRYTLTPFFETETSRVVRSPSRSWPLSVWKHCKTAKYFKSLSDAQKKALVRS